jgi:hypothetical protein
MTLEKIRAALPTHIMLTPGVHRLRDGDEWFSDGGWRDFSENDCKYFEYKHSIRRPIPPHILDNQAYYLWLDGFVDVTSGKFTREAMDKNESAGRLYDKWLLEQMEEK